MKRLDESEAMPTSIYSTDEELSAKWDQAGDGDYVPAFLYVERGPGAGQLVPVRQGPTVIGRASVAELRLQHPSISRRHAQLTRVGDRFYLKDLGSQNGTFANKSKIATEIEISLGDEVALGNALIRLRGRDSGGQGSSVSSISISRDGSQPLKRPRPVAVPEARSSAVSRSAKPGRKRSSSSTLRVAFFAGAIGFGVAGALMFAMLKSPPSPTVRLATKPVKPALEGEGAPGGKDKAAEPDKAKAGQRTKEAAHDTRPPDPVATKERPPERSSERSTDRSSERASKRESREKEKEKEKEEPVEVPKRATILSTYEEGNVGGALTLARKADEPDLTTKLTSFQAAYDSAKEAMDAKDGTGAIKFYEAALKYDGKISPDGGRYTKEIHKQLSSLWTLVGMAHLESEDGDAAEKAFGTALKHDPSNAKARTQLTKLGAAPPAKATPKAAVDDAFSDEAEKPAKPSRKEAKKPTNRAAAIDDAFGD